MYLRAFFAVHEVSPLFISLIGFGTYNVAVDIPLKIKMFLRRSSLNFDHLGTGFPCGL